MAGVYRYAEQEGLLDRSPAAHVRRPRLDYESHATGRNRNQIGPLFLAPGLASASEQALVSLLTINGLRVSEALAADIDALGIEGGHDTLTVLRTGGKIVTIPLAPGVPKRSTSPSANGSKGPVFVGRNGDPLDRHAAWRITLLLILLIVLVLVGAPATAKAGTALGAPASAACSSSSCSSSCSPAL